MQKIMKNLLNFLKFDENLTKLGPIAFDAKREEEILMQERRFKTAELKVSVFETYAVCAALLAGFASSMALFSNEQLSKDT